MNKATLLIAIIILAAASASAQNQGLDPSFANGGILIDTSRGGHRSIADIKLQPDGKLIVIKTRTIIYDTYISRYLPNGTLDSAFGINGSQWLNLFTNPFEPEGTYCALQPNGKILVAGYWRNLASGSIDVVGAFMVRLYANGSIDSAFGVNGVQFYNYTAPLIAKLCLRSDGSILGIGDGPGVDRYICGLKPVGKIDSAFGTNGLFVWHVAARTVYAGLGELSNGNITAVVGYNGAIDYIRLLPSGQPDTTFCDSGICRTFCKMQCRDAIIYPDGRALAAGGGTDDNSSFVTRLKADATIDSSFGTGGDGYLAVPGLNIYRVVETPDGRILCGGKSNDHFAVARLRKDGKGIDTTFGNKGVITTDVGGSGSECIYGIALQQDGKLIAGGDLYKGTGIVRYLPDAPVRISELSVPPFSTLKVYPNPTNTSSVHAVIPEPGLLQLFSIEGRLLQQVYCSRQVQMLNIAELPKGTYLLRLRTADMNYGSLFMKE